MGVVEGFIKSTQPSPTIFLVAARGPTTTAPCLALTHPKHNALNPPAPPLVPCTPKDKIRGQSDGAGERKGERVDPARGRRHHSKGSERAATQPKAPNKKTTEAVSIPPQYMRCSCSKPYPFLRPRRTPNKNETTPPPPSVELCRVLSFFFFFFLLMWSWEAGTSLGRAKIVAC